MPRPAFTDQQKDQLRNRGVCEEQIKQLSLALFEVQRALHKRAARNDLKDELGKLATLSESLANLLGKIALRTNTARGEASSIIQRGYFAARPDDDGPMVEHHLIPRLSALAEAARAGIQDLPAGPTRHRTADPAPIRRIHEALICGNDRAQLPEDLQPSESDGKFREVVSVCYEAAGAPQDTDPLRAIRAYIAVERNERETLIKILDAVWLPQSH